jgi:hypothetical protein
MLTVKLRYKQPDANTSKLLEVPLTDSGRRFGKATTDTKFAAAVAAFGMLLRDSPHRGTATLDAGKVDNNTWGIKLGPATYQDMDPHEKIRRPAIRMIRRWWCCFADANTREVPASVLDLTLARRRYECDVMMEYEPVTEDGIVYAMEPFLQTIEFSVERGTVYVRGSKPATENMVGWGIDRGW